MRQILLCLKTCEARQQEGQILCKPMQASKSGSDDDDDGVDADIKKPRYLNGYMK